MVILPSATAAPLALLASVVATLVLGSAPAVAAEYCVACSGPDASYRCVTDDGRSGAGTNARDGFLCASELAKAGGHHSCGVDRQAPQPCPGETRNIAVGAVSEPAPPAAAVDAPSNTQPVRPDAARPATAPPKSATTQPFGVDSDGTPVPKSPETSQQPQDKSTLQKTWDCMSSLFKEC